MEAAQRHHIISLLPKIVYNTGPTPDAFTAALAHVRAVRHEDRGGGAHAPRILDTVALPFLVGGTSPQISFLTPHYLPFGASLS